jgi:hypothetical protein
VFVLREEDGAESWWVDEPKRRESRKVRTEAHRARALEECDDLRIREEGCFVRELDSTRFDGGVGRCEGDGFCFDEVGQFADDIPVLEVGQVWRCW